MGFGNFIKMGKGFREKVVNGVNEKGTRALLLNVDLFIYEKQKLDQLNIYDNLTETDIIDYDIQVS